MTVIGSIADNQNNNNKKHCKQDDIYSYNCNNEAFIIGQKCHVVLSQNLRTQSSLYTLI